MLIGERAIIRNQTGVELMDIIKSGYGSFEQDKSFGPICWPHFDLFTVHQGQVSLFIEGRVNTLNTQEAILIPAHCSFSGKANLPSLASVFHFKLDESGYSNGFSHLNQLIETGQSVNTFSLTDIVHLDLKRCLSVFAKNSNIETSVSLLSFILAELMSEPMQPVLGEPNEKFRSLLTEIDSNLTNDSSARYWALRANMSESHFRHEFKKQVGVSLANYRNRKKIALACEQLEQSSQSIQQIAFNLGFVELTSFYRLFKKLTQQTPKQFRQSRNIFN